MLLYELYWWFTLLWAKYDHVCFCICMCKSIINSLKGIVFCFSYICFYIHKTYIDIHIPSCIHVSILMYMSINYEFFKEILSFGGLEICFSFFVYFSIPSACFFNKIQFSYFFFSKKNIQTFKFLYGFYYSFLRASFYFACHQSNIS